ncbi:hypothetical protein HY745_02230 [Candidatus Desantisbacteria bacterium]|nr:hypothetical protein [Candidatus Desantisbacteria bacterium]
MIQIFFSSEKKNSKLNNTNSQKKTSPVNPSTKIIEKKIPPDINLPVLFNNPNPDDDYILKNDKVIFNEFSEYDYGSIDLMDLNKKYAGFDKSNEKILNDIEWAIDKLTIEDLTSSDLDQAF